MSGQAGPIVKGVIATALSAGALLISAAPALASSGCSYGAESAAFSTFGDHNDYELVPGGLFSSGTSGWSLTGAAVSHGGVTLAGLGAADSLSLPASGEALSPSLCVSSATPSLRFMARQTSGSWATLNVILQWTDTSGTVHDTNVASIEGTGAWQPTAVIQLSSVLPIWNSSQALNVRLLFEPERYGGNWAIDDVYFDPRMVD
jgi:hypothetical protein